MSSPALIVDGYVRPSRLKRGSAAAALTLFECAAAHRGWRLGRVLEESEGSRALADALLRVESGEIDGLVVARLADLGTTLGEAVAAIDRIRAAGGSVLSVSDGLELGPETGWLVWRLLVGLAEW